MKAKRNRAYFILLLLIFILLAHIELSLYTVKEQQQRQIKEITVIQTLSQSNKEHIEHINESITLLELELKKANKERVEIIENIIQISAQINNLNSKYELLFNEVYSLKSERAEMNNTINNLSTQIKLLNLKYEYLKQMTHPPVDIALLFANSKEIDEDMIFKTLVRSNITAGRQYVFVDNKYIVLDISKLDEFTKVIDWIIPQKTYKSESFDCDDFAWATYAVVREYFGSIAFGVAHSPPHAFNWIIFHDNGKLLLFIIEPQTGEIIPADNIKEIYEGWWFIYA